MLTLPSLLARARMGIIRGEVVFALVGLWYGLIFLTAFITRSTRRSPGELQYQPKEDVRSISEGIEKDQAVEEAKAEAGTAHEEAAKPQA